MSPPYVSVSDYAGWFDGALRDGNKKKPGGGRRLTEDREKMRHTEQEMKDASEDRMRAKTKQQQKDRDGTLEKSERTSEGIGERTKPSAI